MDNVSPTAPSQDLPVQPSFRKKKLVSKLILSKLFFTVNTSYLETLAKRKPRPTSKLPSSLTHKEASGNSSKNRQIFLKLLHIKNLLNVFGKEVDPKKSPSLSKFSFPAMPLQKLDEVRYLKDSSTFKNIDRTLTTLRLSHAENKLLEIEKKFLFLQKQLSYEHKPLKTLARLIQKELKSAIQYQITQKNQSLEKKQVFESNIKQLEKFVDRFLQILAQATAKKQGALAKLLNKEALFLGNKSMPTTSRITNTTKLFSSLLRLYEIVQQLKPSLVGEKERKQEKPLSFFSSFKSFSSLGIVYPYSDTLLYSNRLKSSRKKQQEEEEEPEDEDLPDHHRR